MKYLPSLLTVIGLLFIAVSCRENPSTHPEAATKTLFYLPDLQDARNQVEQIRKAGRSADNGFWNTVQPLWDKAYQETGESGSFLVVPTLHNTYYTLVKADDGSFIEREAPPIKLVVFKNSTGETKSYYVVVTENKQNLKKKDWLKTFTGVLTYYSVSGERVFARQYRSGKRVFTTTELPGGPSQSGRCGWGWACYYTWLEVGTNPIVTFHGYDETNTERCEQTINADGRLYRLTEAQTIWICNNDDPRIPPDNYPQPQPGGGNGGNGTPGLNVEDIIINLYHKPCVQSTFNDLMTKLPDQTGVAGFVNSFASKTGEFANFKLTITVSPNVSPDAYAETDYFLNQADKRITISLRESYVDNATQLSIARTILHESLHAYFIAYLKSKGSTELLKAFPQAIIIYSNSYPININGDSEHEVMTNYVNLMAKTLADFDGHRQNDNYYINLSYGGLRGTSAYNAKSAAEKNEIDNAIYAEANATTNAKGTKCE